jgi:hypothetical protein
MHKFDIQPPSKKKPSRSNVFSNPPQAFSFSQSNTECPALERKAAEVKPAIPPPTTIASYIIGAPLIPKNSSIK